MKRLTVLLMLVTALAVIVGIADYVLADPIDVSLVTRADWDEAEAQQALQPVLDWNDGLEGLHPGEFESFRPPQLYVMDELVDESGNLLDDNPGLVMAWGDETDTEEIIAAWDLVLPVDPDLNGYCISLDAWPRSGMTSISFSLRDGNGAMKGWLWPVQPPAGLPPDTATTLVVRANAGPGEAGSTGFYDGGVDLTQIVAFEFDESGIAQGGIPLPSGLTGFVGQWNYWHDIVVFPCPLQIDIKPGSYPNAVNPGANGVIPVAILTTAIADGDAFDFDATTVDPTTVTFGPAAAAMAHKKGHKRDVDQDGDLDLVLHFKTQETGIQCGDTTAILTATTDDGQTYTGIDSLKTTGCK